MGFGTHNIPHKTLVGGDGAGDRGTSKDSNPQPNTVVATHGEVALPPGHKDIVIGTHLWQHKSFLIFSG